MLQSVLIEGFLDLGRKMDGRCENFVNILFLFCSGVMSPGNAGRSLFCSLAFVHLLSNRALRPCVYRKSELRHFCRDLLQHQKVMSPVQSDLIDQVDNERGKWLRCNFSPRHEERKTEENKNLSACLHLNGWSQRTGHRNSFCFLRLNIQTGGFYYVLSGLLFDFLNLHFNSNYNYTVTPSTCL